MKLNEFSLNQVTLSVTDIDTSFKFYNDLGLIPIVKSDHYARFIVPGNEATLSIHNADRVNSSTTIYFEVKSVDKKVSELKRAGFNFMEDPKDQKWQWREAYLEDPDGNLICIYHAGRVRINPDWRIDESKQNHLLTEEHFNNWLENYRSAWENSDPESAAELFTEDAEYHETTFEKPSIGKANIIKYWNSVPESQTGITFNYKILKGYNNTGYCRWKAEFTRTTTGVFVQLDGIFEVEFDSSGKCTIFKEWWHRKET